MAELAPFAGLVNAGLTSDVKKAGALVRDEQPAIYRYHQELEHHGKTLTRKGFVANVKLDGVKPYRALSDGKPSTGALPLGLYVDRYHMVDTIFEPLESMSEIGSEPPITAVSDGVVHRMWRLTDDKAIERVCNNLAHDQIYLAAGQEHYESQLAAGAWGLLCFCNIDDEGLVVEPTQRVLSGLAGFGRADLLSRAREFFTVSEGPLAGPAAVRPALFGQKKRGATLALVTPGSSQIAYLRLRGDLIKSSVPVLAESRALGELDITLLHGVVLETLLGLDAAATAKHIRYIAGWDAAFAALEAPETQALFLVNPTPIEQMCAVIDEGRVMPPHSTAFLPPLGMGLIVAG